MQISAIPINAMEVAPTTTAQPAATAIQPIMEQPPVPNATIATILIELAVLVEVLASLEMIR
jgi:hypothetical protein